VDNVRQDVPETHPEGPLNASEVRRLERMVLEMANQEREQRGVDGLRWSPELAKVNDYHAWDMWNRDYFYHDEPDGDGPENRVEQFGYKCSNGLSEIQASADATYSDGLEGISGFLISGWLNSDSHRKSLLNDEHNTAGVGIYIDNSSNVYAVMILCDEVVKRPAGVRGTNETVPQPINETRYQPRARLAGSR